MPREIITDANGYPVAIYFGDLDRRETHFIFADELDEIREQRVRMRAATYPRWSVWRDEARRADVIRLPENMRKIVHPHGRFRMGKQRYDLCVMNPKESPGNTDVGSLPRQVLFQFVGERKMTTNKIMTGLTTHRLSSRRADVFAQFGDRAARSRVLSQRAALPNP